MRSTYDAALHRVLAHEGGYTNHPSDPGGPTNLGITIADYRKYVNGSATAADIKAMSIQTAEDIYARHYAAPMRYDELPAGVDYAVLDYGINSGIGRSGKVLRRVCGLSDSDWHVTDAVLAAVAKRKPADLVNAICDERLLFLKSLKTWPVFGAGWGRRVTDVRTVALAMAAAPPPASSRNVAARSATAGGIATSGAAAAAHHAGARPTIVAAIVVAAVALAVCGWLAWRWRRQHRLPASK